jgi:hypothetical protein
MLGMMPQVNLNDVGRGEGTTLENIAPSSSSSDSPSDARPSEHPPQPSAGSSSYSPIDAALPSVFAERNHAVSIFLFPSVSQLMFILHRPDGHKHEYFAR